ncbi:hypothetical protein HBI55_125860 [Parastagonospora nodorum]|nr:hypothetical protein HBI10_042090 [Parastagonospora nodorum]KAH4030836.1 hypothetical protein HBI13_025540 [Parastagonospora nodorum]KAH4123657.1 hypothetical protein HBH47_074510 [Parastagonospora nodorum]KAH4990902.1 hypothetical protein HBI76_057500 [Parastagonospora nodorum]KAH5081778.1 hypothetical protein HBH95_063280 [Parastagonospora nodorum]
MTSLDFDTALQTPDNDASSVHLCELVTAGVQSDEGLPAVAEEYLRAFCNTSLSYLRRRWIGMALAAMLDASSEVVGHMESVGQQLQGLGDVILNPKEREETKFVAGLVMRQALEQHIDFSCFWRSDKVRNSATNFPGTSGPQWMRKFHSFLDTLGVLHLANPITDPYMAYPAAVVGSDGFQWGCIGKGAPVLIAQKDHLTMLFPDESQREVQFLDVPVANINSTKTQRSAPLHDSQSRQTDYQPWDLVITLKHNAETFRLNSSQRSATELTIMFTDADAAKHCGMAIEDLQQSHGTQRTVCRSSPIAITRSQRSQSSSDQLGKTPIDAVRTPMRSPKLDAPKSVSSALDSLTLDQPISNKKTYGNGKLPKVSQALKIKASQQIHKPSEDVDMKDSSAEMSSPSEAAPEPRRTRKTSAASQRRSTISQKKANNKRKAEEDDAFVPNAQKMVKKSAPKRNSVAEPTTGNTNSKKATQRRRSKEIVKSDSSAAASRTSLIGGLLGLQNPSATKSAPSLAPPPPSTPPRRRSLPGRQPRTPMELRKNLRRPAPLILISPVGDNEDDGPPTGATDIAILSSNSKAVPASPRAESTAISGHADSFGIDLEKLTAQIQIMKSDPFKKRREGLKRSSFTRRLTGDDLPVEQPSTIDAPRQWKAGDENEPRSSPIELIFPARAGSEPLPEPSMGDSILAAPQQAVDDTQTQHDVEAQDDVDMDGDDTLIDGDDTLVDGDDTLVNDDSEEHLPTYKDSPPNIYFRSSPPELGTPSSHSSTSAEHEPSPRTPPRSSQAEEMEWEATLQPHQRDMHDLLMRVSKRVLRHVVDNETAVTDIADVYANDGEHYVNELLQRQETECKQLWNNMNGNKSALKNEMGTSLAALATERKRIGSVH